MENITIREAMEKDLEACVELAHTEELQWASGYYLEINDFNNSCGHELLLVAEKDDRVIGFTKAYILNKNMAYTDLIAVSPDFRGQGIGKLLTTSLEQKLKEKGHKYIWLLSPIEHPKNAIFYEKLDYKKGLDYSLYYKIIKK